MESAILSFLSANGFRSVSLREIRQHVGCDKAIANRHLYDLQKRGLVVKTQESHPPAWRFVVDEYRTSLQKHYERNDHHPEHFEDPFEMPLECRMELTCDLLGSVMGRARKHGRDLSVADCRAVVEQEGWPNWKYAVTERLPLATVPAPELEPRWYEKAYPAREFGRLRTGTEELTCVRDYLDDLIRHKNGVFRAWLEVCAYDARFIGIAERIQNHDLDKFRPDMILGYTKRYSRFE